MAQPSKTDTPKKPYDPNAHWVAVKAKCGRLLGPGGIAEVDAQIAGKLDEIGDPMLDLGRALVRALGQIEKCIAQRRMTPAAATSRQMEIATLVGQLALPVPKVEPATSPA